ncbi:hypothetical protein ACQ4M4_28375 [Leptolyngbya sp. AN02str]|uniref:hypothetical protein n=1 Tax=Leptolyngbya sp. AN02str TaxID=3423363 RepID=UPI003D31E795
MTQPNLIELAKHGDPQAIATLMNRTLQPRGMSATVDRWGDRLRVKLEGQYVPNRQVLVAFVKNGVDNLGIEAVQVVEVLGQEFGASSPAWTEELMLGASGTIEAIAPLNLGEYSNTPSAAAPLVEETTSDRDFDDLFDEDSESSVPTDNDSDFLNLQEDGLELSDEDVAGINSAADADLLFAEDVSASGLETELDLSSLETPEIDPSEFDFGETSSSIDETDLASSFDNITPTEPTSSIDLTVDEWEDANDDFLSDLPDMDAAAPPANDVVTSGFGSAVGFDEEDDFAADLFSDEPSASTMEPSMESPDLLFDEESPEDEFGAEFGTELGAEFAGGSPVPSEPANSLDEWNDENDDFLSSLPSESEDVAATSDLSDDALLDDLSDLAELNFEEVEASPEPTQPMGGIGATDGLFVEDDLFAEAGPAEMASPGMESSGIEFTDDLFSESPEPSTASETASGMDTGWDDEDDFLADLPGDDSLEPESSFETTADLSEDNFLLDLTESESPAPLTTESLTDETLFDETSNEGTAEEILLLEEEDFLASTSESSTEPILELEAPEFISGFGETSTSESMNESDFDFMTEPTEAMEFDLEAESPESVLDISEPFDATTSNEFSGETDLSNELLLEFDEPPLTQFGEDFDEDLTPDLDADLGVDSVEAPLEPMELTGDFADLDIAATDADTALTDESLFDTSPTDDLDLGLDAFEPDADLDDEALGDLSVDTFSETETEGLFDEVAFGEEADTVTADISPGDYSFEPIEFDPIEVPEPSVDQFDRFDESAAGEDAAMTEPLVDDFDFLAEDEIPEPGAEPLLAETMDDELLQDEFGLGEPSVSPLVVDEAAMPGLFSDELAVEEEAGSAGWLDTADDRPNASVEDEADEWIIEEGAIAPATGWMDEEPELPSPPSDVMESADFLPERPVYEERSPEPLDFLEPELPLMPLGSEVNEERAPEPIEFLEQGMPLVPTDMSSDSDNAPDFDFSMDEEEYSPPADVEATYDFMEDEIPPELLRDEDTTQALTDEIPPELLEDEDFSDYSQEQNGAQSVEDLLMVEASELQPPITSEEAIAGLVDEPQAGTNQFLTVDEAVSAGLIESDRNRVPASSPSLEADDSEFLVDSRFASGEAALLDEEDDEMESGAGRGIGYALILVLVAWVFGIIGFSLWRDLTQTEPTAPPPIEQPQSRWREPAQPKG